MSYRHIIFIEVFIIVKSSGCFYSTNLKMLYILYLNTIVSNVLFKLKYEFKNYINHYLNIYIQLMWDVVRMWNLEIEVTCVNMIVEPVRTDELTERKCCRILEHDGQERILEAFYGAI